MKRGEVWRVRMPAVPGHAQAGERPAIIVQDAAFNASLPTVLIVPFTSTQRKNMTPKSYQVPGGEIGRRTMFSSLLASSANASRYGLK